MTSRLLQDLDRGSDARKRRGISLQVGSYLVHPNINNGDDARALYS